MSSVSRRVKEIKQPWGGYVRPSAFEPIVFDDGLEPYPDENTFPSIVGMAVDCLTRFMMGEKKEDAFGIAIQGAMAAEAISIEGASFIAYQLISNIKGLDKKSIINACKLVSFDVWYRSPMAAIMAQTTYKDIEPDSNTIANIALFVSRGLSFFENYGPVVKYGFTFEPVDSEEDDYLKIRKQFRKTGKGTWGGYTATIDTGDGDYLTRDTIWDFKVSKSKPKPQHTLQLLVYWIMGQHSGQACFSSVSKIGIFNPRVNTAYLLDLSKVSKEVIKAIEEEVICY